MCTLSWKTNKEGGRLVYFNRDEQLSRPLSEPPKLNNQRDTYYISPLDPKGKGTWFAVNEHGITLALLNNYDNAIGLGGEEIYCKKPDSSAQPQAPKSRGLIIPELIFVKNIDQIGGKLSAMSLTSFDGFILCGLQAENQLCWVWDGKHLKEKPLDDNSFLVSSSYDTDAAHRVRVNVWESIEKESISDEEKLTLFHTSHLPERGPLSPCVHREKVETVSMIKAHVKKEKIQVYYKQGPACQENPWLVMELSVKHEVAQS